MGSTEKSVASVPGRESGGLGGEPSSPSALNTGLNTNYKTKEKENKERKE